MKNLYMARITNPRQRTDATLVKYKLPQSKE
jgi:hypothetical protein